jgi:hypothetical protein
MKKIIFTITFILISVLSFGQAVTMTINGAYADSSGTARNALKLQGKDSTELLKYTKALVTNIPALPSSVQGDLLYASGTNTWANLAKNTTSNYFLGNGGTNNNPSWRALPTSSSSTTGVLSSSDWNYFNDGLTQWSGLVGDTIYYNNTIGIGVSNATAAKGFRFYVEKGSVGYPVKFHNSTSNTGAGVLVLEGSTTSGSATSNFIQFLSNNGTVLGTCNWNGTDAMTFPTISDVRIKENIINTTLTINVLNKIKVRDFNFKNNPKKVTGFIAQELYEVYPTAVNKPLNDADTWTISKESLIPLLVKSIQDQQAEITALTKRIENLEKKLK